MKERMKERMNGGNFHETHFMIEGSNRMISMIRICNISEMIGIQGANGAKRLNGTD